MVFTQKHVIDEFWKLVDMAKLPKQGGIFASILSNACSANFGQILQNIEFSDASGWVLLFISKQRWNIIVIYLCIHENGPRETA